MYLYCVHTKKKTHMRDRSMRLCEITRYLPRVIVYKRALHRRNVFAGRAINARKKYVVVQYPRVVLLRVDGVFY